MEKREELTGGKEVGKALPQWPVSTEHHCCVNLGTRLPYHLYLKLERLE